MAKIVYTEQLIPKSQLFVIDAPHIAVKAKPGQFIVLKLDEPGERIPLTIADTDKEKGTITIIVQEVGKTSAQLNTLKAGDEIMDLLGPLGIPSEIENFGNVVCLGGGFGVAAMFPIVRALKNSGCKVISIIGARNKDLIIWEDKIKSVSDEIYVTTDDGSKGRKGFVSDQLKDMINSGFKIDRVIAIGPVPMMRAVSKTTESSSIKTIVSLNPIMLDATGLCGVCRVTIAGKAKFACVDGPEFDGHDVNWEELMARLTIYNAEEKVSYEKYKNCCGKCKSNN